MRRAIFLLFIMGGSLLADDRWPDVEFSEVRAFAWPDDKMTEAVILPGMVISPGSINTDGFLLSQEQISRLRDAVSGTHPSHAVAGCHIPHNAFVFYDSAKRPVAYLELCFGCRNYRAAPSGSELGHYLDFNSLASIFGELSLPMGEFKTAADFQGHFRKLEDAQERAKKRNAEGSDSEHLVLVGAFDNVTKAPVAGVRITAEYMSTTRPPKVIVGDEAVTDDKGQAVLRARYSGEKKPHFMARITSPDYEFLGGIYPSANDVERFTARLPSEKPDEIDLIFWIASVSTMNSLRQEKVKKREAASREAERLYREEPDYWPPRGKDPYPWAQGDSAMDLIAKRWNSAGKKAIGGPAAAAEIRSVVRQHMSHPKARVEEIRWINSATVMAVGRWYEGPMSSAVYTYVLKRDAAGKWRVLTYYMNSIS